MSLSVHTTIRNMDQTSATEGFDEDEEYEALVKLEEDGTVVKVICEAIPGYFDVSCNGRTFIGLSWYHLEGFNQNGPEL